MLRKTTIASVLIAFGICLPALAADGPADAGKNCGDAVLAAALPQPLVAGAADGQVATSAYCEATANCQNTTVTCSTTVSGASCTAVDASCPEQRGYVTCNGQTTYCPACQTGGGSGSCWVQGAPCGSNSYCAAKCSAYCNNEGGYCSGGSCECFAF